MRFWAGWATHIERFWGAAVGGSLTSWPVVSSDRKSVAVASLFGSVWQPRSEAPILAPISEVALDVQQDAMPVGSTLNRERDICSKYRYGPRRSRAPSCFVWFGLPFTSLSIHRSFPSPFPNLHLRLPLSSTRYLQVIKEKLQVRGYREGASQRQEES